MRIKPVSDWHGILSKGADIGRTKSPSPVPNAAPAGLTGLEGRSQAPSKSTQPRSKTLASTLKSLLGTAGRDSTVGHSVTLGTAKDGAPGPKALLGQEGPALEPLAPDAPASTSSRLKHMAQGTSDARKQRAASGDSRRADLAFQAAYDGTALFLRGASRAAAPHIRDALDAAAAHLPERPESDKSLMPGTLPGSEEDVRDLLWGDPASEPNPSLRSRFKQKKEETKDTLRNQAADRVFQGGIDAAKLVVKGAGQALNASSSGPATEVASPTKMGESATSRTVGPRNLASRLKHVAQGKTEARKGAASGNSLRADLAFQAAYGGAALFLRGASRAAAPHVQDALDAVAAHLPERPEGDKSLMPGTLPGSEAHVRDLLWGDPVSDPKPSLKTRFNQKKEAAKDTLRNQAADRVFQGGVDAAKLVVKGAGQALARQLPELPGEQALAHDGPRIPGEFPGDPTLGGLEDEAADTSASGSELGADASSSGEPTMPGAFPEDL